MIWAIVMYACMVDGSGCRELTRAPMFGQDTAPQCEAFRKITSWGGGLKRGEFVISECKRVRDTWTRPQ